MGHVSATLSVAAGGGGDALAALIVGRARGQDNPRQQMVASFSWDRYLIDPTPGPRTVEDFSDLHQPARHVWEVTGRSQLRSGGTSGLSVLATHTDARFFLLDPSDGVAGLRRQLDALAQYVSASAITLVDVGGDIAARGDEPNLLSPLADSMALAAVAGLPVGSEVVVAGPGLDGELPEAYVRSQMGTAGHHQQRVSSSDAKNYVAALDHHPSEATALLSAAAIGIEGKAEIRDSAALVPLGAASADLLVASCGAILANNSVASSLAPTRSFAEAEQVTRAICGRTELDHERAKAAAAKHQVRDDPPSDEIRRRIEAYRSAAARRGADLVSFRRLTEAIGLHRYDPALIRAAAGELAYDDVPLCRI